jgi:hypothetical protein
MLEVRGQAEVLPAGGASIGRGFDPEMFRIKPRRIVSIGVDGEGPFLSNARSVT